MHEASRHCLPLPFPPLLHPPLHPPIHRALHVSAPQSMSCCVATSFSAKQHNFELLRTQHTGGKKMKYCFWSTGLFSGRVIHAPERDSVR